MIWHKTNEKRISWVREHTFMTTAQKVGEEFLKFFKFFLKNWSMVYFCRQWGWGKKFVIYCWYDKWMTCNLSNWMNLLLPKILEIMIQVIQGYKTKSCSAFKTVEPHRSLFRSPNKYALNFNILYNANVILSKFLYRQCLLFRV